MGRSKKLRNVAAELSLQKNLMGVGKKTRVKRAQPGKPAVYRWKQERKR